MPATVRVIDFRDSKPGKKYEPGEHKGCQYVNLYHMHVKRAKKRSELPVIGKNQPWGELFEDTENVPGS